MAIPSLALRCLRSRAHTSARASSTPAALASLALVRVGDAARFGSVDIAGDGRVTGFREKAATGAGQHASASPGGLINAGVYVVERELLASLPSDRAVSLEREVFPGLTDGRLQGVELTGPFVDIGVPESYAAICADPSMLLPMLEPA